MKQSSFPPKNLVSSHAMSRFLQRHLCGFAYQLKEVLHIWSGLKEGEYLSITLVHLCVDGWMDAHFGPLSKDYSLASNPSTQPFRCNALGRVIPANNPNHSCKYSTGVNVKREHTSQSPCTSLVHQCVPRMTFKSANCKAQKWSLARLFDVLTL